MTPTGLDSLYWHRSFGRLVDKLDAPDFWLGVARLLRDDVSFESWVALIFSPVRPPEILAESDTDDGSDEQLFRDYQQGLYLLDPFYIDACSQARSGLFRLDDVAPEQFVHTEYYQRYFHRNIVADEIQFNVVLDNERTLCLSLGSSHRFRRPAIGVLTMIQPWLLPLMRQRMHFEKARETALPGPHPWHPQSELPAPPAITALTDREREVSQLMLGGCSTKEIARRLGISVETVRAHKKHLYAKLNINSQSELFALFWQARKESAGARE
ncbi:helix-turn-helix transcriptional regulator [Zobellella endophytica]|uniref:Helix-turn-helix transcriptional regulator n=1 Tax=Zobellella endophytica TaxID=2116700 RepID=A0A2P7R2T7_9GAMM|nr:helix-turn-helix transcriptional regulator [Zobellella endophytica]